MAERKKGNCYMVAFKEVMRRQGSFLVHGAPWSEKFGQRIGHAWVEYDEEVRAFDGTRPVIRTVRMVADLTVNERLRYMPAAEYYRIGRMTDAHVIRYTDVDACVKAVCHKHFGPWEGPADECD